MAYPGVCEQGAYGVDGMLIIYYDDYAHGVFVFFGKTTRVFFLYHLSKNI